MKNFQDFTGLYKLDKTLRFNLIPIGKTRENIDKSGLLEQDGHRAESYMAVKKLIDEYHKFFIDKVLKSFCLVVDDYGKCDSLSEYMTYYAQKGADDKAKEKFAKVEENLRKQISKALHDDKLFKRMFKSELIKDDLPKFLTNEADKALVKEFDKFTTYFVGFHENRKNMYEADDKSTAIAYRLIHENLPKFVDNMGVFGKIASVPEMADKLKQVYADFESYLNVMEIGEMFSIAYFNEVLTQKQIDVYNAIIGGRTEEGVKIQGINEYVNLYNQRHKDQRLPLLKPLYKQILSDRENISWLPEVFANDGEALVAIQAFYQELHADVLPKLKEMLLSLGTYDTGGIFIPNDLQLTNISQKAFGQWDKIQKAVMVALRPTLPKKRNEDEAAYEDRLEAAYKKVDSFSLKFINDCMAAAQSTDGDKDAKDEAEKKDLSKDLLQYYAKLGAVNTETVQKENFFLQIANAYTSAKALLTTPIPAEKNLAQDKEAVAQIKNLLDVIKSLQHYVKPLMGKGDESDKDDRFYGDIAPLWDKLNAVTRLYDKVRNHLTRKPYSKEKIKLNFENSTLMAGWDENKERANTTVILRKDGKYYLAIMNKKYNKAFDPKLMDTEGDCYEKMVYKLMNKASANFPRLFITSKKASTYNLSEKIKRIYETGSYLQGDNFCREDMCEIIDFYKRGLMSHPSYKIYKYKPKIRN